MIVQHSSQYVVASSHGLLFHGAIVIWYCWHYSIIVLGKLSTPKSQFQWSLQLGTPSCYSRVYRVVSLLLTGSSIKTNSQGHLYRAKAQEAERHGFFHGFTNETRLAFAKGLSQERCHLWLKQEPKKTKWHYTLVNYMTWWWQVRDEPPFQIIKKNTNTINIYQLQW